MNWFLVIISVVAMFFYPMMQLLMFIYCIFEKLVHMMDKKVITEKQLEKGFWIASIIISVILGVLVVYIRSCL